MPYMNRNKPKEIKLEALTLIRILNTTTTQNPLPDMELKINHNELYG